MDKWKLDFLEQNSSTEMPEFSPPQETEHYPPNLIVLFSGKRKSGKDYIAGLLKERLDEMNISAGVLRMANPVKQQLATMHGLDYEKMLGSGTYKEQHRLGLANLSVDVRLKSIGYYPHHSILSDGVLGTSVWICPDVRHTQDIDWFRKYFPGKVRQVRVEASVVVRQSRGFIYVHGIDNGPTECDLDGITSWDLVIINNGDESNRDIDNHLETVINWITTSTNQLE